MKSPTPDPELKPPKIFDRWMIAVLSAVAVFIAYGVGMVMQAG